jgi:peptide/nickel transport system substrate-binding protein
MPRDCTPAASAPPGSPEITLEEKMRVPRLVALLAFVGSVLLTPPPAIAMSEGQLTWGVHVTLASRWLDPAETEGLITPFMIHYALQDALVKPMPDGRMTPSLAKSWSMSKDGLVYEFVLRPGLRFHDGEPVTADDVKFSFTRYKGSGAKLLKERVAAVEVVDQQRVRFRLKNPWPDFMTFYGTSATGAAWIVPRKYVEKVGDDGYKKAPVGAGPYKFVSFQPGVELVAEAFEGYWRKVPSVKRIVLRSLPDEATRAAALKRGEVDITYLLTGPIAQDVKRTPGLKLVGPLLDGVFWLDFPDQWDPKSPWHDQRVRLAASLALDRQAINDAETLGLSRPTGSIITPGFEFALAFEAPPYDPARAKKLLAEAGYPNGFDAGDFYPFPPYTSMGEAIAGYLEAIGIRSRIATMERAAFLTAWREKKLHGLVLGITGASGNAATRLEAYVTRTGIYAYGVLPEVEDLFERQALEQDRTKREALLRKIQQIIHDRVMHAPIYQLAFPTGVGPRVGESGMGVIPGFAYSAPYEDLTLKK